MLQSSYSLRHLFDRHSVAVRLVLAPRWTHWLIRCWHAACRRAQRADRRVPYY